MKAGGDPAEIAKKYGVEAYSSEESNTPETFGEPFSDYAKKLKNGECTPVLDIESCYAIMQMVKVNNEQIASEIREYYQADMKDQALEYKSLLNKIEPDNLLMKTVGSRAGCS